METAWGITAAVVGIALTVGVGLMVLTPAARMAAVWCFFLSGAWLGVIGFMWLVRTPASLPERIAAGLGIGAFVFVVVPLLIRFAWPIDTAGAQPPPPSPPPQGSPMTTPTAPPAVTGSITTTGQSGGINNTGNMTINQEDRSVKRKLRDLLDSIDTRIIPNVESGQMQLKVRMQPFEEQRLQALIAQDGSYVTILGYGRKFIDSTLMNGTLGPQYPVHEQREVILDINRSILP